jgi:hypothetical protein
MRQWSLGWIVGSVAVVGAALGACGGSDSSGPSGISCTAGTPNLTGTWTLDSLDDGSGPLSPPAATGSFVFTGDSVYVALNITGIGPIDGAGKCTLTATKLSINGSGAIGQASGSYTFVDATPVDTLHAILVPAAAPAESIRVVVTR